MTIQHPNKFSKKPQAKCSLFLNWKSKTMISVQLKSVRNWDTQIRWTILILKLEIKLSSITTTVDESNYLNILKRCGLQRIRTVQFEAIWHSATSTGKFQGMKGECSWDIYVMCMVETYVMCMVAVGTGVMSSMLVEMCVHRFIGLLFM